MSFVDTNKLDVIERLPGWYGRYFHSPSMTFAHFSHFSAGIGTPHARWREIVQSGRVCVMLRMRSRDHGGNQVTASISEIIFSRSP